MARTRIVATLGPATDDERSIGALLDAGVHVVRLNFSHGSHAEHGRRIQLVRRLAGVRPVAILQDLGGPKLRLAHHVAGQPGDVVEIRLPATVQAGDPVLLADGLMQLEVIDASRSRVVTAGDVPPGKGVNLPSSRLDLPPLTDKDRADLRFGVAQGVDAVALSSVEQPSDLDEARACGLPVIAKIERARAIQHLDALVEAADGILVARGDLGPAAHPRRGDRRGQRRARRRRRGDAERGDRDRRLARRGGVRDGSHPRRGRAPPRAARARVRRGRAGSPGPRGVRARGTSRGRGDRRRHPLGIHRAPGGAASPARSDRGADARGGGPPTALPGVGRDGGDDSLVPDTDTLLAHFRDAVRPTALVADGTRVVITAGWPITRPGITNLVHVATM